MLTALCEGERVVRNRIIDVRGTLFSAKKKNGKDRGSEEEREREREREESHEHALGYTSFQGPLSDRSKRRPSKFHGLFATSAAVTCSRYALLVLHTGDPSSLVEFSFHFPLFVFIPSSSYLVLHLVVPRLGVPYLRGII